MNKQVIAIGGGGFGKNGDCSELKIFIKTDKKISSKNLFYSNCNWG